MTDENQDWWSPDDYRDMEEAEHQEMLEMASECTCGAWQIVGNDVVHGTDRDWETSGLHQS